MKFSAVLSVGTPYMEVDSGSIRLDTRFGLVFNTFIEWTPRIRNHYYKEPSIIYAGNGIDEYAYEIDFTKLPLNINNEIHYVKEIQDGNITRLFPFDEISQQLDFNETLFFDILQNTNFNRQNILEIIDTKNYLYIGNKFFSKKLLSIIGDEIIDFSVSEFYHKAINKSN